MRSGDRVKFRELKLEMTTISEKDIRVEGVFTKKDKYGISKPVFSQVLEFNKKDAEGFVFETGMDMSFSGVYRYSIRIIPKNDFFKEPTDMNLVKWL